MAQGYEALSGEQKARVNAVIIAGMRNDASTFERLREGFGFDNRRDQYDKRIGEWRDALAGKINALPELEMPQGPTQTLIGQNQIFRQIGEVIGNETPHGVYRNEQLKNMLKPNGQLTMLDQGLHQVPLPMPKPGSHASLAILLTPNEAIANLLGPLACSNNPENGVSGPCDVPNITQSAGRQH